MHAVTHSRLETPRMRHEEQGGREKERKGQRDRRRDRGTEGGTEEQREEERKSEGGKDGGKGPMSYSGLQSRCPQWRVSADPELGEQLGFPHTGSRNELSQAQGFY